MKKLLVLLLALTVVCGAAFAQAKVTGRVHADAEADFSAMSATVVPQARLNFGWDSEDGTAGIHARAQAKDTTFDVKRAWAYAKFFDGVLKVTGGYTVESYSTWNGANTSSEWFGTGTGGIVKGTGVYVEVVPAEGLSLVAGFLPNAAIGMDDFQFQVGYSMADVLSAKVDFAMEGTAPKVHADFNLKAVENLRFTVVYDLDKDAKNTVYAFVGYNVTDACYVEVVEKAEINAGNFGTTLGVDYAFTDAVKAVVFGEYVVGANTYVGSAGVKYAKSGADYQLAFAYDGAFKVKALTRVNF